MKRTDLVRVDRFRLLIIMDLYKLEHPKMCRILIALVFNALVYFAKGSVHDRKIICHYNHELASNDKSGKYDVSSIDPTLCTHLIYSSLGLADDFKVKVLSSWLDLSIEEGGYKDGLKRFVSLRKINPKVKMMISIGGSTKETSDKLNRKKYLRMMEHSDSRGIFINSTVSFIEKRGFDGVAIDWASSSNEGPQAKENFSLLMKELYAILQAKHAILSAVVEAFESAASRMYEIPQLSDHVDFIDLRTFHFHKSNEKSVNFHSALYHKRRDSNYERELNVNSSVGYWLNEGVPAEKLIIGIPFHGISFTLADPNKTTPGSRATGPGIAGDYTKQAGILTYNEICLKLQESNWTTVYDNECRVPYAYSNNQWVGYENPRSLTSKVEYIKTHGFGGVSLWNIGDDDFNGQCGDKYVLTKTVVRIMQQSKKNNLICEQSGYVRDAEDCGKFYQCQPVGEGFQIHEHHCQSPLVFDILTNTCNWRDLTDC